LGGAPHREKKKGENPKGGGQGERTQEVWRGSNFFGAKGWLSEERE